ncbi:hypothetical protein [Aeromicrobium sp. Root472D3]|uniref:hypothetical protein n=1 Tax=Aeromicrobium sp. Root472D3 TaxID=1736540 RepID=UPI0006F4689D|nr:hypothetical protein [Aeromicrobium sp. Root472D3]KQX75392.1 hypothetical protein ASD10_09540 [Aeromicrobium sp. Root472D3]
MLREVVFETIEPDGYTLYGTNDTEEAIERLVGIVMRSGQRVETHELIRGMLADGSLVMTVDAGAVRFDKGDV